MYYILWLSKVKGLPNMQIVSNIYNLFWGDLFFLPLPGGGSIGISLLVVI